MLPRVTALLRRMGADPETAVDVAQETALSAMRHEVPFTDAQDLLGWALVVAKHNYLGVLRRRRAVPLESPPERRARDDVESIVVQRDAVARVGQALSDLSERDRALIRSIARGDVLPKDPLESRREAVRRFRARARLLAKVEGFLAGLAWLVSRLRSRPVLSVGAGTAVLAAALGVTVTGLVSTDPAQSSPSLPSPMPVRDSSPSKPVLSPTWGPAPTRPVSDDDNGAPKNTVITSEPKMIATMNPPLPVVQPSITAWQSRPPQPLVCQSYEDVAPSCVTDPLPRISLPSR